MHYLLLRGAPAGLLLAFVLITALVTGGCGAAGGSAAPGGGLADAPAAQAAPQALGDLPRPSQLGRAPAMIDTPLRCFGAAFRDDLPHQNVVLDGTDGVFTPASAAGAALQVNDAAFAVYEFDLSPLPSPGLPLRVKMTATATFSDGTARVFCGLADVKRDKWNWGELQPDALELNSWSFGETQMGTGGFDGGHGAGRVLPHLPIIIVAFGAGELQAHSLEVMPDAEPLAAGPVAFRKGWDGTIKGNIAFDDSCRVLGDGQGTIYATFYDDSNGQLNLARLRDRICTFKTVDCDSDAGLSHDLLLTPSGGLLLPYIEQVANLEGQLQNLGLLRTMSPANMDALVWSPRSNFELGFDEMGTPISAGAHPRIIWDDTDIVHTVYEDETSGRIRHAWRAPGMLDWLHDYVSPEGVLAGRPVVCDIPGDGVVCVYMAEGKLYAAGQGSLGWEPHLLADDVFNPLDGTDQIGFCDGAVRPGEGMLVVAYSAKGGGGGGGCGKVVYQDIHFAMAPSSVVFNATDGSGAFIDLNMMGDGSVRIAQFNPKEYKVYFETSDVPSQEFTSLPAVQFGEGEDCDDLDFWVEAGDLDGDGFHDACLVTLTSSMGLSASRKKEYVGHVTLMK